MDFVKAQLERIQKQLNGLSASQKMLTVALVAIMVITLWWGGKFAGTPEMLPVLDQAMTVEDIGRIRDRLASEKIPYQVNGDRVLVPVDRKLEVLAILGYAQALPRDMKTGFEEIVKQQTAWDSPDKTSALYNYGKEITLGRIIGQLPGVAQAVVVIDPTSKRALHNSVRPSAAVNITMRQGMSPNKNLVDAVASLVSGSLANLDRARVNIVIDGHSFQVNDRENNDFAFGNEARDVRRVNEQDFIDKIERQLSYMPGALVAVTCEVSMRREERREHVVDASPDRTVHKEIEVSTRTEETSTSTQMGADPGSVANVGMSTDEILPAAPDTSTVEQTDTRYTLETSKTDSIISLPAGETAVKSASVMLPRSYFVEQLKNGDPDAPEPDESAILARAEDEIRKVTEHVMRCTGLTDESVIAVSMYADMVPAALRRLPQGETSPVTTMVLGGHAREIALGGLALVSLFMLMMIVRKNAPAPVIATPIEQPLGPVILRGGEELAGEAGDSDAIMEGMELDEDTIKTQQMIGQVQNMVKENPDAAAQLIKRWLNRT